MRLFALALVFTELVGCSASTGEVTGTVSCRGKSVTSGTVMIVGSDGLVYYGSIEDDGSYCVFKVPTGLAKMAVLSPGPEMIGLHIPIPAKPGFERKAVPRTFRGDPKKWFPLSDKYREFDTSGLTVTVTGGVNEHDISLE
jgi:hypothetical protein